jgi:DNA-binding CsgD family transcriptional regulator
MPITNPPSSLPSAQRGGGKYISIEVRASLFNVTERQIECLTWVQEGKSASDIGGILGISRRTVEGHIVKICEHLGVKTRLQAVLKARELGLIGSTAP